MADRLELREHGPQDAAIVKALVETGDRTSLPPGVPSQPSEVDEWLADGVHQHRREGGGVHLMMAERSSAQLVGSIGLFKTDWEARLGSPQLPFPWHLRFICRMPARSAAYSSPITTMCSTGIPG